MFYLVKVGDSHTVREANSILKRSLGTDRWFFEERSWKVVFLEKLKNTYNFIFPLTDLGGNFCLEVRDSHIQLALRFVRRRRKFEDRKLFDKKMAIISGEKFDE